MELTIREFKENDKNFYIEKSEQFYTLPAVSHKIPVENFNKAFALCIEKSPYLRGFILEYKGIDAGYILLSFSYSNESAGICVWIEELYVLPEFQGLGIAKEVFKYLEEKYISSGKAARFRLEASVENEGAIRLYESLGYRQIEYINLIKEF